MKLNESKVTKLIMEEFFRDLSSSLELDVAVVGAGPSGMVAAYYLSKAGYKTAIFERRMSIGGGIWGGGMMFNKVVVEEQAKPILEEFGVSSVPKGDDLLVVDAVELASSLCLGALRAGARVYNLVTVEDVAVRDGKVVGVVINWSAAGLAGLHVDPMVILSRRTIDATGHECDVCRIVEQKAGELDTPTGKIMGEGSMWAEKGEESLVPNSREVFPNLFVAGMAANAVFGSPRMGPVFGGMLLSGKACAERVSKSLRG